jgi:hypothetical protein
MHRERLGELAELLFSRLDTATDADAVKISQEIRSLYAATAEEPRSEGLRLVGPT